MSGIFSSMNTATKGLMASQTALHTTGHNISNVNTEGFTRQRVDMQADRAFNLAGVGQLGTGVRMQGVVRMIDDHVSKQIRDENSTLNRFTEKSDALQQLEVIFNEPSETGLNSNISKMFDAFVELSKNPESLNSKTVTVEQLKTLTETMNHMANQIGRLEDETHANIDQNILDFNSTVDQLKTLNKQIFNISIKGQVPNDLLDQRDVMLKKLTSIADVSVELDKYGRVDITMGDDGETPAVPNSILTKEGVQQYLGYEKGTDKDGKLVTDRKIKLYGTEEAAKNASRDEAEDGKDMTKVISNGKLLGNLDALDSIKEANDNLDKTATIMAQAINHLHVNANNGIGGKDNLPIFTFDGYDKDDTTNDYIAKNVTAKNIRINKEIVDDPGKLQAGKLKDGETGAVSEGNGSLALEIAQLRNQKIGAKEEKIDGEDKWVIKTEGNKLEKDDSGNSIGGSYRDIVIKTGVIKNHSDNMIDNQTVLTNQLEMRRESVSGVSLNDEMTNVIKFQKAYEANAKVISALTDMLDVLINRTGV